MTTPLQQANLTPVPYNSVFSVQYYVDTTLPPVSGTQLDPIAPPNVYEISNQPSTTEFQGSYPILRRTIPLFPQTYIPNRLNFTTVAFTIDLSPTPKQLRIRSFPVDQEGFVVLELMPEDTGVFSYKITLPVNVVVEGSPNVAASLPVEATVSFSDTTGRPLDVARVISAVTAEQSVVISLTFDNPLVAQNNDGTFFFSYTIPTSSTVSTTGVTTGYVISYLN